MKLRDSFAEETTNPNTCSTNEGNWGANEYNEFEVERQQKLRLVFGQGWGGAQTLESVAPPRRAQMEHVWLKYMHTNRGSCHEGADIADKQQLMVVMRMGESTPWGADHAK